eukprot:gene25154-30378_t
MVRLWLEGESRMFWVLANAGMGKSAFAASLVEYMQPRGRLAACFLCKHGNRARSQEEAVLRSLAFQVAHRFPECRDAVVSELRALQQAGAAAGQSLRDKMAALLCGPLQQLQGRGGALVLVVDALDEIGVQGSRERKELLRVLVDCLAFLPAHVKLLVTSRPELDIQAAFKRFEPTVIRADDPRHQLDLREYVAAQLRGRVRVSPGGNNNDSKQTEALAVDLLLRKSEGRFVYMAQAVATLFAPCSQPTQQFSLEELDALLPDGLDEVYLANFRRIRSAGVQRYVQRVRPLLCLLVGMLEPLGVRDAQALLQCSAEEMQVLVGLLSSMFPVIGGDDDTRCFTVFHKTVAEWLRDAQKSRRAAEEGAAAQKVQEYFQTLRQEGLDSFDNLEFLCSSEEEWRACFPALPAIAKAKIREYVKARAAGNGNTAKAVMMQHDFFVSSADSHEAFSGRMLALVGVSVSQSSPAEVASSLSLQAAPTCGYLLRHMVHHLAGAGRVDVAQMLLLQLPWLLLCLLHREKCVFSVIADMQCVSQAQHSPSSAARSLSSSSSSSLSNALALVKEAVMMSASTIAALSDVALFFTLHLFGRLRQQPDASPLST